MVVMVVRARCNCAIIAYARNWVCCARCARAAPRSDVEDREPCTRGNYYAVCSNINMLWGARTLYGRMLCDVVCCCVHVSLPCSCICVVVCDILAAIPLYSTTLHSSFSHAIACRRRRRCLCVDNLFINFVFVYL